MATPSDTAQIPLSPVQQNREMQISSGGCSDLAFSITYYGCKNATCILVAQDYEPHRLDATRSGKATNQTVRTNVLNVLLLASSKASIATTVTNRLLDHQSLPHFH